jgi:hypothetical protein
MFTTRGPRVDEGEKQERSEADRELEREIRKDRKFSLSEAIARLAGPGAMKGASPVTLKRQAEAEVGEFLEQHLPDAAGSLRVVLLRRVVESQLLLANLDQPLVVLGAFAQRVRDSEFLCKELVREADVEWGRAFEARPILEQEGEPPNPDDPYTATSVGAALSELLRALEQG